MSSWRATIALVLIAALGGGALLLQHWRDTRTGPFEDPGGITTTPRPTPQPGEHWSTVSVDHTTIWTNNDACLACHPGQATEWQGNENQVSLHFWAFLDPWYRQQAVSQGGDFDCLACHISEPVYEHLPLGSVPPHRQIPDKPEIVMVDGREMAKPLPGVTCLTCHVKGNSVMARRTIPDAPCNPVAEGSLTTAEMCHGCHKAYGKVNTKHEYDEWLERDPRNKDIQCQDCHMDPVTRAPALGLPPRPGRHHGFHVMDNPDLFNKYFEARLERNASGGLEVVLENKGTAHGFPTGYTVKSVVVRLQTDLDDEANGPTTLFRYEIRKASPFGGESTQLLDFEVRRIPVEGNITGPVRLDCLYKPYLNVLDSESRNFFTRTYTAEEIE